MATDIIRYDLLAQEALRGVVRRVIQDCARDGLPGEHHFYISFKTGAPGVRLSPRLRERYPDEMTIILQYQFWDLAATEQAFEVGLSFGGVPEKLHIPYDAITGFFDPSVQFGLKFEVAMDGQEGEPAPAKPAAPVTALPATPLPSAPAETRKDEGEAKPARKTLVPATGAARAGGAKKDDAGGAKPPAATPEPAAPPAAPDGAQVVRLDTFRKKS